MLLLEFGVLVMMMTGINFEPGEIIYKLHAFPGQRPKNRPVVIISKQQNNIPNQTFICLPITKSPVPDPDKIALTNTDMDMGQMKYDPCYVVCDIPSTLLKSNLGRKVGKVNSIFYQNLQSKIKNDILELS